MNLEKAEAEKNKLKETLLSFRNLEPYWDGPETVLPTEQAFGVASNFLKLLPIDGQLPQVSIGGDGEIDFYWDSDEDRNKFIDVSIYGDGYLHILVLIRSCGLDFDASEVFDFQSPAIPEDLLAAIYR